MALPVVLIIGGWLLGGNGILGSISSYYHSNMQDVFVGILWVVGLFLISYKGYDCLDDWVTNLSGIFAIGVALFPTIARDNDTSPLGVFQLPPAVSGTLHLIWAFLFFLLLAYNSYFLFTKTGSKTPGPQKIARNRMYRICGIIIIASLSGIVLYMMFLQQTILRHWAPVLILETIALWAFGLSWLVKGETLFRD
ncbi:DUF998 domain-containing protein [Treponema sp. J25]|uniref:DUF998 domain-containing protein n=1 Tax=Treponema sp. J25 TaxID=2094121 RepID=UPI001049E400|nr:DUF998 domain-containing protein [Treponema sp. J25]